MAGVMLALAKLVETSATASAAADRVIAVANVDTGKIAEGFNVLFVWGMKIATLLFEEISKNPSLNAKMTESQQMLFGNSDLLCTILKFGSYITEIFGLTVDQIIKLFLGI